MTCDRPLGLATLLDWWLWEAPAGDGVDEHLLGCDSCAAELGRLVALGDAIRRVVRDGGVRAVVPASFVERIAAEGLRLREYRVAAGGSVACTLAPDDDILVARLVADVSGASRVDLAWVDPDGNEEERIPDVPVGTAGEIVWVQRTAVIRALPATTLRARVLAVADDGERVLGEYTFNHTPSS
jgi:hypothetical protein